MKPQNNDLNQTRGSIGWKNQSPPPGVDPNRHPDSLLDLTENSGPTENSGFSIGAAAGAVIMICIAIAFVMGTIKLGMVLFT